MRWADRRVGGNDDPMPMGGIIPFAAAEIGQRDIAGGGDPFVQQSALVRGGWPRWKLADDVLHCA